MIQRRRVVCTGIGAVSCFGLGLNAFWDSLRSHRSGQALIRGFDASSYRGRTAAEVPPAIFENRELFDLAGRPEEAATHLATVAALEALSDAGLMHHDMSRFGCSVGTLCSSSRNFELFARHFVNQTTESLPLSLLQSCSIQHQLDHLVRRFGFEGPSSLVSTACSSATDAIGYAADLIRRGECDVMLAGGGDILSEVVHAGFDSVFSLTKDRPRPFDLDRDGFFIGEGAGMLVLESLEHADARRARARGEFKGYGLSNSAHHLTATSEDGVGEALAIERCLDDAHLTPEDVDYVNAHGTGTPHNDMTETRALRRVFGERMARLPVTSIKANIGHCMGASGALEAIATLLCIEHGFIPGTLHTSANLDPAMRIVTAPGVSLPILYAVSESFGFGGASSALLLAAPPRQAGIQ